MALNLPVSTSEVPENLECVINNANWQELVALLGVELPDGFRWLVQSTTPAPEDRIWPWFRLDGSGLPIRPYIYAGGSWLAKHPMPPGAVIMWEGAEANIPTFDEGEAGAITPTTGALWEKVSEMNGRIPAGPGQLDAGPPIVNLAINEDKGAYDVQLTDENYQRHRHLITARQLATSSGTPNSNEQVADEGGGLGNSDYTLQGTGTPATGGRTSFVAGASQTDPNVAFAILPQVRGIFFLRRTARLYYRV